MTKGKVLRMPLDLYFGLPFGLSFPKGICFYLALYKPTR
jgi:hypothetical protein